MVTKFSAALSGLKDAKTKPEETPLPEKVKPVRTTVSDDPKSLFHTRPPGRPKGRASDPDYTTTTILIPKVLRAEVMAELALQKGVLNSYPPYANDMSGTIEALLREWLEDTRRQRAELEKKR